MKLADFEASSKVNALVKAAGEEIRAAQAAEKVAKDTLDKTPRPASQADFKGMAALQAAEGAYRNARLHAQQVLNRQTDQARWALRDLRGELENEITTAFTMDAAAVDPTVLALLETGTLSAADYQKIVDDSLAAQNYSTARLAGAFAGKQAKRTGSDSADSLKMTEIAQSVERMAAGRDLLAAFDVASGLAVRCIEHPLMFGRWEELSTPLFEAEDTEAAAS